MYQDSLRSAVFRSLVKNETLECDNISRPNPSSSSPMEHILGAPVGRRGRDMGHFAGEEKRDAMELRESSDLQLLQVSKEANRLTRMIDSWSRASNLEGRSKAVAEDLLRGALDLQESLAVLGKLQDVSKHMTRGREDVGFGEVGRSARCSIDGRRGRLQEPRLSVDGSSKDCIEELRRVIRDSFYRQNLLSRSSGNERALSSRSLRFSSEMEFKDKHFIQTEDTFAAVSELAPLKKAKAPNLIAKLMGLEEVPSETTKPRASKSEIEIPKMRKLQTVEQSLDQRRKTLQEIIGGIQFEEFAKSGQVEESRVKPLASNANPMERYGKHLNGVDDVPPIVIIKPLKSPPQEKGGAMKDLQLQKITIEETKTVETVPGEKVPDKGAILYGKLQRKKVKNEDKSKMESKQKVKALNSPKEQRKGVFKTYKKNDDGQKPLIGTKKLEEKKDVKDGKMDLFPAKTSKAVSKTEQKLFTEVAKPEQKPLAVKSNSNGSAKHLNENFVVSTKEKKTRATAVKASTTIRIAKESKKGIQDHKPNKASREINVISKAKAEANCTLPENCKHEREEMDHKPCNKDEKIDDQESYPKALLESNSGGRSSALAEEAAQLPTNKSTVTYDLKCIVLSNKTFLLHAQEFLNPKAPQPMHQTKGTESTSTTTEELLLDCAKELLTRKSHQKELASHPMAQTYAFGLTLYLSLDLLLQEINNGFEKLTSYNLVDADATSEDKLYLRLEKDIRCKDMLVNSMWDVGWLNPVCSEEADHVVESIGENLLCLLVEEVAMELLAPFFSVIGKSEIC